MSAKRDIARASWINWVQNYGVDNFYDAFVANAQGARSKCVNCGDIIFLDIVEGVGIPDWKTREGDYGCALSSDTGDQGVGSHFPERIQEGR